MTYHKSVLLEESIALLHVRSGGTYVDATFGGGGHAREILRRLGDGRLVAFDQDEEALDNRIDDSRLVMVNANFRYLRNFLKLHRAMPCDGILADLGLSSHQIDEAGRGFSTRFDGRLDMRMDRKKNLTARSIVNEYSEADLARLFKNYGEIKNARKLASRLAEARKQQPIETTGALKEIVTGCADRGKENKYLAQVFQALRMEVNQEIASLREFLKQSSTVLKPGGRLVVIAYHSLEDRLVKHFIRAGNFEGEPEKDFFGHVLAPLRAVNRKVIVPAGAEIEENSRSRSARLRAAEKVS